MIHRRVVSIFTFFTLILGTAVARAQDVMTSITFDDFPVDTLINTQYTFAGKTALFHENFIAPDQVTSGNQVLVNRQLGTEFGGGNLLITFLSPQNSVSLNGTFFGLPTQFVPATLQAFDANDNLLEQSGPVTVSGNDLNGLFFITRQTDEIDHVRFIVDSLTANAMIDNLIFTGAPPPAPSGQPVVVITTPTSGFSDLPNVTISGTVTATNLYEPVKLTKEFQAKPGQVNTSTTLVGLTPTGNPNEFSFSFQESIPSGQVTLRITAQNVFGITGSDEVFLTNLPGGVVAQCTPTGPLGTFQYAIELGTCTLNICQFGAVSSHDASGTSHILPLPHMEKWLLVNDRRLPNNLGCPTTDSFLPTTQRIATTRQDFERGRLYHVPTGVFYVPTVFAQAMAVSGEEDRVGVPVADPSINNFVLDVDTDWFQHFDRRFIVGDLGSTMEIRKTKVFSGGRSPELVVERQGSDLNELLQIDKGTGSLSLSTATQWERFPCTGSGPWTCTVTSPKQHTPPTQKLLDDIHGFCSGGNPNQCVGVDTFGNPCVGADCAHCAWLDCFPISTGTEWGSLAENNPGDFPPVLGPPTPPLLNFIHKNFRGWVNNAHFASSDYPFTHSFTRDFTTHMRQLPEYDNLIAGQFDEFDTEVEIEWYYFQSMWGMDLPGKGDLYHVYGRWITDCGHHPYPSEIHPPGIMATIRTAPWPTTASGSPTTNVHLAANGFFFDSDTIRIDPPPRPSPNAGLFVVMPSDGKNDFGDITIDTKVFVDHIEITLKRTPPVTDVNVLVTIVDPSGEMFWHGGLGSYSGIWNVGWQ